MKYLKLSIFASLLLLICCFFGCSSGTHVQETPKKGSITNTLENSASDEKSDDIGSRVHYIDSVSEIIKGFNTILISEYSGEYETYGRGNGDIIIGGRKIDDNSYYALCKYKVIKVIKGNKDIENTELKVNEYIGSGEYVSKPISDTLDNSRHLLFLNYDKNEDIYSAPAKEYCVHIIDKKGNIT